MRINNLLCGIVEFLRVHDEFLCSTAKFFILSELSIKLIVSLLVSKENE